MYKRRCYQNFHENYFRNSWIFRFFTNTYEQICSYFCAAVIAIGILSGRLACGNGNEKTLVLQWTNKKSKAKKIN
jgi:hypothetical protein